MKLNSLYVGVTNMKQSIEFYKKIFQREPLQDEDRFSMFDLDGMYFGLFNAAYDNEKLTFGNNCVPNIEVRDVDFEFKRIAAITSQIDPEIRRADGYEYFQFKDPDGNYIELYEIRDRQPHK